MSAAEVRDLWDRQDQAKEQLAFSIARVRALELSQDADELDAIADGDRATIVRVLERPDEPAPVPDGIAARLGWRLASELDTAAPPALLLDRLDPLGHTILFGGGGVGKGVLATHWTATLARSGLRVALIDYEHHPDEWGRRLYGLGASDVWDNIGHVAPHTPEWDGPRGPIWTQAPALRELVEQQRIDYVVIDSIVFACPGADPSDPDTVSHYSEALSTIGVPALSLAHVPKAGKELTYPFGSAFWHNQARMTWSLEQDGEHALLTMRKANNYRRAERARVTVTWVNDRPVEVVETPYQRVLVDRIRGALGDDQLTVKDITTRVNEALDEGEKQATADTVRRTLNRHPDDFSKEGDRWRRS